MLLVETGESKTYLPRKEYFNPVFMTDWSFYIAEYFVNFYVVVSSVCRRGILTKQNLTCYRGRVFSEANVGARVGAFFV